jgi:hypothetical protein
MALEDLWTYATSADTWKKVVADRLSWAIGISLTAVLGVLVWAGRRLWRWFWRVLRRLGDWLVEDKTLPRWAVLLGPLGYLLCLGSAPRVRLSKQEADIMRALAAMDEDRLDLVVFLHNNRGYSRLTLVQLLNSLQDRRLVKFWHEMKYGNFEGRAWLTDTGRDVVVQRGLNKQEPRKLPAR